MAIWGDYYANYRLVFLMMALEMVVPPLAIAAAVCRIASWTHWFYSVITYVLAIPTYWTFRMQYDLYAKKLDATRKGAVLMPEVNGRWIGNIDLIFLLSNSIRTGYAADGTYKLFERVGEDVHTFSLRILWKDTVVTRDPRVIQHVLATGFSDFEKGADAKLKLFGMFGNGIFNTDGVQWKAHRTLIRPFFARERVTDYGHFEKYSNKVIQLLKERADSGQSFDIQDIFGRFTLDAAGEFLFGTSDLNTLDVPLSLPGKAKLSPKGSVPEDDRYGDFVKAFEHVQIVARERGPWGNMWPLREFFKDASEDANSIIDKWVEPLIYRALDAKAKREKDGVKLEEGSFLDHMVESTNEIQLIRDELINILLASRDTTAALLTFFFYLLSLHPEVLSKLRSEILALVPTGPPTYEDVRKLRYLRACLNETLRLFPPVPANVRSSVRPCVLPVSGTDSQGNSGPLYIPESGAPVFYSPLIVHRRKDLWGEDADDFVPERWTDPERVKAMTADPFRFVPFNAGPRICPGQNFAYNQASFVVIRILQNFDSFETCQEDAPAGSLPPVEWQQLEGGRHAMEKIWPKNAVTLFGKGGVWLRVKHA